jgi:Zn-dependent protease with chaperone function
MSSEGRDGPPLWGLVLMAGLGSLVWHGLMLAPWALSLGLGALWLGQSWLYLLAGTTLLFLAWLLSPNLELSGQPLKPGRAPGLFAEIERLRRLAGAPPVHRVLLDDALNAGAASMGRFWWPGGARRTLVLGLPLLASLTPDEASAVLAHELGHFSRRHDRWGQWLYRTRRLWLSAMGRVDRRELLLDQFATRFANWFAPRFGRLALQHARRCEHEADACAARAGPPEALLRALLRLQLQQSREQAWADTELPAWQLETPQAPAQGWWGRWARLAQRPADAAEVAAVWQRTAAADDSHPAMSQRARALGVGGEAPPLPPLQPQDCAGACWLGAAWEPLLAEHDAAWQRQQAVAWHARHLHLNAQSRRLQALAEAEGNERAALLAALGRRDAARDLRQALMDAGDAAPMLHYTLGLQRLADGDPQATARLEQLVADHPAFAWPVRLALAQRALAQGDELQAGRQQRLAEKAARRRAQALDAAMVQIEQGGLAATRLADEACQAFDAQCAADDAVQAAWLGEVRSASADGRVFTVHALLLRVDADRMLARGQDEDDLTTPFVDALHCWREGPHELVLVRAMFLAERSLPAILARGLGRAWRR